VLEYQGKLAMTNSRRRWLLLLASAVLVVVLLSTTYLALTRPVWESGSRGTMLVNDSGQSRGGFGYAGTYDVALNSYWRGSKSLTVSLRDGQGDPVQIHSFNIVSWDSGFDNLTIISDQWTMVLLRKPNASESTWYYVAEWSPSGTGEGFGQIRPSWFGLPDTYYLKLALDAIAVA